MSNADCIRLRELLSYNRNTGVFTWRTKPNRRIVVGTIAGTPHSRGYINISFKGKPQLAHRLAWLHVHGAWPEQDIDHINGVRNDNRLRNLRLATRSENMQNTRNARGVFLFKRTGRWRADIQVNKVKHYLGYFDTEKQARAAYLEAKQKLHPFTSTKKVSNAK